MGLKHFVTFVLFWATAAQQEIDLRYFEHFINDLADEKDFEGHLDEILTPRAPGTEGSKKVREYISSILSAMGWTVEVWSSNQQTPRGNISFHNVVATLDNGASSTLVLACHYDSLFEPVGFLGAIDAAVPCAQLLNLAHTMNKDLKEKSKGSTTLQLIFFDGEEAVSEWKDNDNTYGSRSLAAKWDTLGTQGDTYLDRIDLFVLLDLIGAKDPAFLAMNESTLHWFQRLVDIELLLEAIGSLGWRSDYMFVDPSYEDAFDYTVEDDHTPFMTRGVSVLHLISLPFPEVWHTVADNRDTVDLESVADINKILRVFVAEYLHLRY